MSDFKEYPKALYRDDQHVIVNDKAEEKSARSDGYRNYNDQTKTQRAE